MLDSQAEKENVNLEFKPMHEKYVEPSKHMANIIVPDGGENVIAAEMIISYIREQLGL